ncbi:MAG: SIMPL domain-containing protein [Candidatus Saccharimonadales bacterium]
MKQSITIRLNAWIICAVLLATNLISVGFWQPWNNGSLSDRKISITGTTTIEAEADQFVFSPYYQKTGTDQAKINTELNNISKTVVAKLKALGVSDSSIKTDASTYNYEIYYGNTGDEINGTLYITVTVKDKALAQKVQDYLVTTSATGSSTPAVSFSVAKQKTLETQARDEALKNAKEKAEASASQLGATLGKVISVTDSTSNGVTPFPWGVMPLYDAAEGSTSSKDSSSASSLSIQPGLNSYSFSVEVTYELK